MANTRSGDHGLTATDTELDPQERDYHILATAFRDPFRVKSNFGRTNILDILRLIEEGYLTTLDPIAETHGSVVYVTFAGAHAVFFGLDAKNSPH